MSMRKSTRQELRKLREMVRWAYANTCCCFCHEPLLEGDDCYGPGDGESSPMNLDVTLHHKDGDHSNNDRKNHRWSHRRCHKSFHLKERHKANRKIKKQLKKKMKRSK